MDKMKPLAQQKRNLGEVIRADWYFDTWISKLVLIICALAVAYSVLRIWAQGFW